MTDTIEYTYTNYKIPSFSGNETVDGQINNTYVNAIAERLFPGHDDQLNGTLEKVFGYIQNEGKTYICGFIGEYGKQTSDGQDPNSLIIQEMYFVTIWYEGTTEGSKQQINCYKCNTGKVSGCGYTMTSDIACVDIWEGTSMKAELFGFCDGNFCLPKHSFFLEGDHQEFSDLPAGKYGEVTLFNLGN